MAATALSSSPKCRPRAWPSSTSFAKVVAEAGLQVVDAQSLQPQKRLDVKFDCMGK
jgi:hypothetical protein